MSHPVHSGSWKDILVDRLRFLGHRNWIVIADSAYPLQTAEGIETKCTGDDQVHVVRETLDAIAQAPHVRPIVHLDAELPFLTEPYAPGIEAYREGLSQLLEGYQVQSRPHDEIIAQLDEAGQTFHVLLLKTNLTLPYTSVFVQLDCGYWNEEAERELRRSFRATGESSA
jgi:hypothetical protein